MRLLQLLFLFSSVFLYAQKDSVILLNGKVYSGTISSTSSQFRNLEMTILNAKGESEVIDLTYDRIFSYSEKGVETVIYLPNEFQGDFLSIDEARNATLGSYDARQTFKPRIPFYSSLVLGYGVSLLDTYFSQKSMNEFLAENNNIPPTNATVGLFGKSPTLFPVLLPLAVSATWAIPSFRIKPHQLIQKSLYGDENYYRGFHRIARQKRVLSALTGSAIGIAAGMISYYIFTPN